MAPRPGDRAPGFTLAGTEGGEHRDFALADYAGRRVVLVFYPGDNTPVCTRQLNAYTTDIDRFRDLEAAVLAISPQSVASHDGFDEKQGGFAFPLLADPDKAVGEQYGVVGPLGFYRRSVFVIDGDGIVRYAHRAVAGLTFRPVDELVAALSSA